MSSFLALHVESFNRKYADQSFSNRVEVPLSWVGPILESTSRLAVPIDFNVVPIVICIIRPVYIWPTSSEPGLAPSLARCLAPIRACLHYRGRAPRQLDHQYGRPQFASCRACVDRFSSISTMSHAEIRWLVCNNYENSNLKKLFDVALFVNSRRHNSADQLSPHCVVIIAFLY